MRRASFLVLLGTTPLVGAAGPQPAQNVRTEQSVYHLALSFDPRDAVDRAKIEGENWLTACISCTPPCLVSAINDLRSRTIDRK